MNDHQRQDETIFHAARQLIDPVNRQTFIDLACEDDVNLKARVQGLLESCDAAGGFFEKEPMAIAGMEPFEPVTVAEIPVSEGPGTTIGRYKLLQRIGEGGMGVVYMSEQTDPVTRKVALKIIKLGMDTKPVVARFEAERQALAMMDHPNIAKVLDAGATETGRPYFVMELVRGVPITEYCDKNKLATGQRLELFMPVCQAIHHAHQKGVIHRDIKPSNVMVTLHDGNAVPKVIDFGIAKATNQKLTEKTLFTNYSQMIGTPAYMSPEQAEMSGLDVDTRTDVYALGVLLYELLTGTTPFPSKELLSMGYGEMQKIIAEKEPPKPSTRMSTMLNEERTIVANNRSMAVSVLGKTLQGDLDWIVMKALEKDRTRRYESSFSFAQDVEHYLNDEPVSAAAPGIIYQVRKFSRRNRTAVATVMLFAITLLLAAGLSTRQAIRATKAEKLADDRATSERLAREAEATERKRAEANERKAIEQTDLAVQRGNQARETATRLALERADTLLTQGRSHDALMYYADVIRQDASNQVAISRAFSLLTQRQFVIPEIQNIPLERKVPDPSESFRGWKRSSLGGFVTAITQATPGRGERLRLWSVENGRLIFETSADPNRSYRYPLFNQDESLAAFFVTTRSSDGSLEETQSLQLRRLSDGKRLWECMAGDQIKHNSYNHSFASLTTDKGPFIAAHRTPDGTSIRCAAWSVEDGKPLWTTDFPFEPGTLNCAVSDRWFAVALAGKLRLLDIQTGQINVLNEGHVRRPGDSNIGVQFLPDGSGLVLVYSPGLTQIVRVMDDLPAGRERCVIEFRYTGRNFQSGGSFVLSPDGRRLYAFDGSDIIMMDTQTGRELNSVKIMEDKPGILSMSHDGRIILHRARRVTPYDAWSLIRLAEPWDQRSQSSTYRADRGKVVSIESMNPSEGLKLKTRTLDPAIPGRHTEFLRHEGSHRARFSRDGNRIISVSNRAHQDPVVRIFDASTLEILETQRLPIPDPTKTRGFRTEMSLFGSRVFIRGTDSDQPIRVYSVNSKEVESEIPGNNYHRIRSPLPYSWSADFAMNPTGNALAAFDLETSLLTVSDLDSNRTFQIKLPKGWRPPRLHFSPQGRYLAFHNKNSLEDFGSMERWSVREGRKLYSIDPGELAFSPSGDQFFAVDDDQAFLFNSSDGSVASKPWPLPSRRPQQMSFRSGTSWVASSFGDLRATYLWDFDRAELIQRPIGAASASRFSLDGK